ncbi:MAG: type II toxin-antitoxin system Phd/YefM family antitoxin [bacterium]
MNPVALAEDLIFLGEFKTHASQYMKALKGRTRPLVVTVNGRAAAVVISPEAWDRMQYRERLLADVQAGREDIRAGGSMDSETLLARLQQAREARGQ